MDLQQPAKKSVVYITLLIFIVNFNSFSQYELVRPINNELRSMFSQISFPSSSVEFLYQRSANMVDSSLYQHYNDNDTVNTEEWKMMYQEMFYASHDTTIQTPFDFIEDEVNSYQKDTVNFGIMFWDLYRLKKISLQNGNYFVFDTANNKLHDHPTPTGTPYILDSLFVGAPLGGSVYFKSMTYRINPAFIFTDANTKNQLKDNYTLKIDFGDGIGFRTINPNIESFIPVTYSTSGEKIIKTALFSINGIRSYIYSSISRIYVTSNSLKPIANRIITDIPGMTVGVYNSCQALEESKKVIFVEGFDFSDFRKSGNRDHKELYDRFIIGEKIHHLQNFGYEYYVIDWRDSKKDMRFNAYNLLLLIEKLKQEQADVQNNQEFVLIGESMGGVIGRYVINYMESSLYQQNEYEEVFFVEQNDNDSYFYIATNPNYKTEWQNYNNNKQLRHNTRLLITLDSPHQGANMPLAYQYLYRLGENTFLPHGVFKTAPTLTFQLLDRKASRQLLKNWMPPIQTMGAIAGSSTSSYTNEESHDSFFEQSKFENNGNPRFCKMMALSDGALDGSPQRNPNTFSNRIAGDYFLDVDYTIDFRVLWVKRNIFQIDFELRSSPNQSTGRLVKLSYGKYLYKPKLFAWGVTLQQIQLNAASIDKYVTNTISYDNVAGGLIYLDDVADSILSLLKNPFLSMNVGFVNDKLGIYNNLTFYTDGMSFCFVPLESALDYNRQDPSTNTDILNETIDNKLSLTPFDVFTGFLYSNEWHTSTRNPLVYNFTQQDAAGSTPNTDERFAYHTCATVDNYIPIRTFLSQEIGDEELYLENFETDRVTSYRPEWDIHVNHRNPSYYYSSQLPNPQVEIPFVYSKENDFNVVNSQVSNGYATFFYDNNSGVSPTPGLNINYLNSTQFTSANIPFGVCCATERSSNTSNKIVPKKGKQATMSVYPNPSLNNDILMIKANFPDGGNTVNIEILDVSGKIVYTLQANTIQNTLIFEQPINISMLNLKNGIYILNIKNDSHSITEKLIIQ